jgi:glycyl-tRNA synthetase beta chain
LATFLLEIGTEELPADFARQAIPQLQQMVTAELDEHRLSYGAVRCTSTPRRLAIWVNDLEAQGAERKEERKGPPGNQSFKNGEFTEAALGFARRCGVEVGALELRETPKGAFLFAKVVEPGSKSTDVLVRGIPNWIKALQGRRFMRWGNGDERFSRPLRWLVAMLDQQLLELSLLNTDPIIEAGKISRGHRLGSQSVTITNAAEYQERLRAAGVIVDRDERAQLIKGYVNLTAAKLNCKPDLPRELFDELIDLVEAPLVVTGIISSNYLSLPSEVLSTVMRSHQRYIPLYAQNVDIDPLALTAEKYLLAQFICITNGRLEALAQIQRGNERVLKARLADAEFFIQADLAIASEDRRSQLAKVSFADRLGSLLERTERLEWCVAQLIKNLKTNDYNVEIDNATEKAALRAAHFCKNDLVSQVVGEFPELQGIMGGKYLLAEGEDRETAQAVLEHYLPRGVEDDLPTSKAGSILAIAERIELIVSIYSTGERPSGSSDPYGLRRAGNGIILILWQQNWNLNLVDIIIIMIDYWQKIFPQLLINRQTLALDISQLLLQRLQGLLNEQGFEPDITLAVTSINRFGDTAITDVVDSRLRAILLTELRKNSNLHSLQAVVQRAARLADKGDLDRSIISPNDIINSKLFEKESENNMLIILEDLESICTSDKVNYIELAAKLASSSQTLSEFFDGANSVMVMVEDQQIKNNRLNLLGILRNQANMLGDFSCLNSTFNSACS